MYFDPYSAGKRIQKTRKAQGLTQEQFAVKLNISDRHRLAGRSSRILENHTRFLDLRCNGNSTGKGAYRTD